MSVREKDDPSLFYKIQEQNLLRQYDLLSNCIEIGLKKDIEAFDKYTLWALNYAAVSNICQLGGRYREGPIREPCSKCSARSPTCQEHRRSVLIAPLDRTWS